MSPKLSTLSIHVIRGGIIRSHNERCNLNDTRKLAENKQLGAALAQMSHTEVARMLGTISALQADLFRVTPLFNGEEPVEAVTHAQCLLKILHDDINRVLRIKQAEDIRDHSQLPDNEGGRVKLIQAIGANRWRRLIIAKAI